MRRETYKNQSIISGLKSLDEMKELLRERHLRNVLLVCSESAAGRYGIDGLKGFVGNLYFYHNFSVNPVYEEVVDGVKAFHRDHCDAIISIGGGSAIDVAKCIKAFAFMEPGVNYLLQEIKPNRICHIAIPTTAGTGSESTSFAVVYYEGSKKSVSDSSMLPDYAVLLPDLLRTLPLNQKKATVLDALCQGIESYWSMNATAESREYAGKAIRLIMSNIDRYITRSEALAEILEGANDAGRAINVSKTTAAHAMSYKLTSLYKIPHGHAAAICLPVTWRLLNENLNRYEGVQEELEKTLRELSALMGCRTSEEAADAFCDILDRMEMEYPKRRSDEDIEQLAKSVNIERLQNFPIPLTENELKEMYQMIVRS